jgi:hypothetical protein
MHTSQLPTPARPSDNHSDNHCAEQLSHKDEPIQHVLAPVRGDATPRETSLWLIVVRRHPTRGRPVASATVGGIDQRKPRQRDHRELSHEHAKIKGTQWF